MDSVKQLFLPLRLQFFPLHIFFLFNGITQVSDRCENSSRGTSLYIKKEKKKKGGEEGAEEG